MSEFMSWELASILLLKSNDSATLIHVKQRVATLFLSALLAGRAGVPASSNPNQWSKSLDESHGFRRFDKQGSLLWQRQQGIRYIAADRLAIYQVQEQQPGVLKPRDASGGAGRFHLRVAFLNAHDGRQLKTLDVQTNAYLADVLPTHDGQFLIHAGEALYLYSASFELLHSRPLPLTEGTLDDWWDVGVSPAGTQAFLVHHQIFKSKSRTDVDRTDVEMVNADTLEHLTDIPLHQLIGFSAGDGFLVTRSEPAFYSGWGILDLQDNWTQVAADVNGDCFPSVRALAHQLVANFACNTLSVKPLSNREVFSKNLKGRDAFVSVANSGYFLAAEVGREGITERITALLDPGSPWKPVRIELYDLSKGIQIDSVEVQRNGVRYDVSAHGDLAVVEGDILTVYKSAE
jgi:hypothetical protein